MSNPSTPTSSPAPVPESTAPAAPPGVTAGAIQEVVLGLMASFDAEGRALAKVLLDKDAPETQRALEAVERRNPGHFHLFWTHPHTKLTRGLLSAAGLPHTPELVEIFSDYSFYERQFKAVYEDEEGGACCADKSRWAMRVLVKHFELGQPVVIASKPDDFWMPKKVLKTPEALVEFFTALRRFKSGSPNEFIRVLHAIRNPA